MLTQRRWVAAGAAALAAALAGGCSHGAGTGGVAPTVPATAGSLATNNPAAGQPNHITPEMQAQIAHYQSRSSGTPGQPTTGGQ